MLQRLADDFVLLVLLLASVFMLSLFADDIAARVRSARNLGSYAEWFTGITTGAVAILAWRTSREATKTATIALDVQLRQSASALTWTLKEMATDARPELPTGNMERMAYGVSHPYQGVDPVVQASVGIFLRNIGTNTLTDLKIKFNDDVAAVGDSSYGLLEYAGEIRPIRPLAPGEDAHYVFHGRHDPATETNIAWGMDVLQNRFVDWVEYVDHGRRWRRDRAGVLSLVEDPEG